MLKENNLIINESKTEEYVIGEGEELWKKCKFMGSKIDTAEDIKARKGITIGVYRKLENIFKSRKIGNEIKLKVYKTYICSVFLYNSEIWTLSKTMEEDIDIFQRKQLRSILGIYWPNTISNEDLYEVTQIKPWNEVIRQRRLQWFGHMMRLPLDTPAQKALQYYLKPVKKYVGRPQQTWISNIYIDIKEHSGLQNVNFQNESTTINDMYEICRDRVKWKKTIKHMMLQ